jgi:threonylcarbamoyladenosine tRNA methylthiotransferase MtaB
MTTEVITLGCRLNLAESERIRTMIGPDTVVVNSCAVTAEATRQSRRAVRRARAEHPGARVIVTGCAATIELDMFAAMPEVDGVVPNDAKLLPATWGLAIERAPAVRSATHTRAFVPVQTGCDHACTFCVIPQGRGASRSLPPLEVLRSIREHIETGTKEVVLTGVDLTSWGADLPDRLPLGTLVATILGALPDLPRLRLSSLDGVEIDDHLFDLIAHHPRVMPHVHLSLQAGDDMVLKRMKRRHSRGQALDLVGRLRAARPDIAIGADLIAGFPTETPAMHANSLALIAECAIVHGHVFPYSPRPGTPAARMPQVDALEVRARAAALREAVAHERALWLGGLLRKPQAVLAERDGTGHSGAFAPYRLPPHARAGEIITITPTRIVEGILHP